LFGDWEQEATVILNARQWCKVLKFLPLPFNVTSML